MTTKQHSYTTANATTTIIENTASMDTATKNTTAWRYI
jgi:hypothetical protein